MAGTPGVARRLQSVSVCPVTCSSSRVRRLTWRTTCASSFATSRMSRSSSTAARAMPTSTGVRTRPLTTGAGQAGTGPRNDAPAARSISSYASPFTRSSRWSDAPQESGLPRPSQPGDVLVDHHFDQLTEGVLRRPAQHATRLGGIADEQVDLGRAYVDGIDDDVPAPVQTCAGKRDLAQLAHRVRLAGRD